MIGEMISHYRIVEKLYSRCGFDTRRTLMRITLTFVLALIVSLTAPVQLSALDKKDKAAIKRALQLYGWSLPLCAHPIDSQVKPYCFTIAKLIQRYPFHSRYISEAIYSITERRFAVRGLPTRLPERIIEILTEHGTVAGCIPKGKNRGPITLGQLPTSTSSSLRLDQMMSACDSDVSKLMPGMNFTLGVLVGGAPDTAPLFSLDPTTQASYQNYLERCKSQTASNPRSTVAQGNAPAETEEEKKRQSSGRCRQSRR